MEELKEDLGMDQDELDRRAQKTKARKENERAIALKDIHEEQ